MKKLFLIYIIVTTMLISSNFEIEIKDKNGKISYKGKSSQEPYLYVCYKERIKINIDNKIFLKYKGCFKSKTSCRSIGYVHFGKYTNEKESYKALKRCINSKPRFID